MIPQFRAVLRVVSLWTVVLLGFAAGAVAADPAAATWTGARIVDPQGWEYRDVSLRWTEDGAALEVVRPDGAARRFAPEQIGQVFDAEGRDITAQVRAARPGADGADTGPASTPPPPPVRDGVAPVKGTSPPRIPMGSSSRPAAGHDPKPVLDDGPRLFSVALDAAVGYATTTGQWFSGVDDGVNLQFGLRAMVAPREYLRVAYRRQDLGTYNLAYDEFGNPVPFDLSLAEYQFTYGRHSRLNQSGSMASVGYLEVGAAAMVHKISLSDYGLSDTDTKVGLVLQGGVLVLFDESLALDLSASGTWKPSWEQDEGAGLVLGAHVGLCAFF